MKLKKVCSGGQTGADIGGILAANKVGLETGGWAPKGWWTEKGPMPQLADFGLQEHQSMNYPARTYQNVKDADATIRFAVNFDSTGEKCTYKGIVKYGKPYIDVHVLRPRDHEEVVDWLIRNNVETLNVAGNRESTSPGLEEFVVNYLTEVFRCLKEKSEDKNETP